LVAGCDWPSKRRSTIYIIQRNSWDLIRPTTIKKRLFIREEFQADRAGIQRKLLREVILNIASTLLVTRSGGSPPGNIKRPGTIFSFARSNRTASRRAGTELEVLEGAPTKVSSW